MRFSSTSRLCQLTLLLAMTMALGSWANSALAQAGIATQPAIMKDKSGEPIKVGGDYRVSEVGRLNDHEFRVQFKAVTPTGKFDVLNLTSDHVHMAVKVGLQLRLSAEILSNQGDTAEVAQMVIFFPSAEGRVPVWLLSSKAPVQDLHATKYIDMHVPLTDYLII